MAGSLNGIGAQPQIPLANTFQPTQNSTPVKPQQDAKPEEKTARTAETSRQSDDTRETKSSRQNILEELVASALSRGDNGGDVRRGSVVDITV